MKKTFLKYLCVGLIGICLICFFGSHAFAVSDDDWMKKVIQDEFESVKEFKGDRDIEAQKKKIQDLYDKKSYGQDLAKEIVTLQELAEGKKAKQIKEEFGDQAAEQYMQLQRLFIREYNLIDKVLTGEFIPDHPQKTQSELLKYTTQARDMLEGKYDPKKIETLLPKLEKAMDDYEKERNTNPEYSVYRQPYIIIYEQAMKFGTPKMIRKRREVHTLWMFMNVGKKDGMDATHQLYNLVLEEVVKDMTPSELDQYDECHMVFNSLMTTYHQNFKLKDQLSEDQKKFQIAYVDIYRVMLSEYDEDTLAKAIETLKDMKGKTE